MWAESETAEQHFRYVVRECSHTHVHTYHIVLVRTQGDCRRVHEPRSITLPFSYTTKSNTTDTSAEDKNHHKAESKTTRRKNSTVESKYSTANDVSVTASCGHPAQATRVQQHTTRRPKTQRRRHSRRTKVQTSAAEHNAEAKTQFGGFRAGLQQQHRNRLCGAYLSLRDGPPLCSSYAPQSPSLHCCCAWGLILLALSTPY